MAELTSNTSNVLARSIGIMSRFPALPVDYNKALYFTWYVSGNGITINSYSNSGANTSGNTSNITAGSDWFRITADVVVFEPTNSTFGSFANVWLNYTDAVKSLTSWIKWSDIGSFSFDIDRKNLAGEMPLDWRGEIYSIRKLNKYVMVYGSGGISQLIPQDNVYGLNTISKIGVKGRFSVTGDDTIHVFVDSKGRLCKLEDGVVVLGYAEYLSSMTSHVLSYDNLNRLVYICDGTSGYVYSVDDQSLGDGPINITGIGYSNGQSHVVTSGTINIPNMEVVTDILDFGSRKDKTIHEVELGTNLSGSLEASVDFSLSTAGSFVSAGWFPVTPDGIAYVHCFGKEFRVRVRCSTSASLDLDYMKIHGVTHRYNPLDS